MDYRSLVVGRESGGDPNATNPLSSATGAGQFIDSTWVDLMRRYKPDMVAGMSDADVLALRKDPKLSGEMVDVYGNENAGILSKAGLPVTDQTKYLAHFAGPGGAVGLLSADPSVPAASILGQRFVRANPTLAGKTAGELIAWAAGNKDSGRAAPLSMAGPARGGGGAAPADAAGPAVDQPEAARAQPQAAPARAAEPDLSGLFDAPKLQSILPARPRLSLAAFKPAPFSFRGR